MVIVISIKFDMIGSFIDTYTLSQFLFYIGASMYVGKLIMICFQFGDLSIIHCITSNFIYLASSFFIVAPVLAGYPAPALYIAMYVLF